MPTVLDYKTSVPSNNPSGGVLPGGVLLPFPLTTVNSPVILADLGMFLTSGAPNRVECKAIVGLRNATVTATVQIEVLRDSSPFFSEVLGLETTSSFYAPTILAIDYNVPAGFHVYQARLTLTTGANVEIRGPVEFSGLAISLT